MNEQITAEDRELVALFDRWQAEEALADWLADLREQVDHTGS